MLAGYKQKFRPGQLLMGQTSDDEMQEVTVMLTDGPIIGLEFINRRFSPIVAGTLQRGVVYGKRFNISKFFAVFYDSTLLRHWDISSKY
jgi:hypothetical protein